jgi:hypothetical protein
VVIHSSALTFVISANLAVSQMNDVFVLFRGQVFQPALRLCYRTKALLYYYIILTAPKANCFAANASAVKVKSFNLASIIIYQLVANF